MYVMLETCANGCGMVITGAVCGQLREVTKTQAQEQEDIILAAPA